MQSPGYMYPPQGPGYNAGYAGPGPYGPPSGYASPLPTGFAGPPAGYGAPSPYAAPYGSSMYAPSPAPYAVPRGSPSPSPYAPPHDSPRAPTYTSPPGPPPNMTRATPVQQRSAGYAEPQKYSRSPSPAPPEYYAPGIAYVAQNGVAVQHEDTRKTWFELDEGKRKALVCIRLKANLRARHRPNHARIDTVLGRFSYRPHGHCRRRLLCV